VSFFRIPSPSGGAERAKKGRTVFLGYSLVYKGYKCLDLTTNRVYISRYVIFDEQTFPFIHRNFSSQPSTTIGAHCPLVLLSNTSSSVSSLPLLDSISEPNISTSTMPATPAITKVYTRHKDITNDHSTTKDFTPVTSSSHSMITRSKAHLFSNQANAFIATD
jgi:hypothetical protein